MSFAPEQNYSAVQLAASSKAASTNGVPVYLLRGVTGYKYGPGATPADFSYVAGQLKGWYSHFYSQTGSALLAWQRAAAQEMPGASASQVAAASSYITTATGTILGAPLIGLGAAIGAAGDAVAGAIGGAGFDVAAGAGDIGSASGGAAGDIAGAGAGTEAGAAAGAGAGATVAKIAASAGLAGLLGLTGWGELAVRIIEGLAGAALILLGLQAITGNGSGSPVAAVKSAARVVR